MTATQDASVAFASWRCQTLTRWQPSKGWTAPSKTAVSYVSTRPGPVKNVVAAVAAAASVAAAGVTAAAAAVVPVAVVAVVPVAVVAVAVVTVAAAAVAAVVVAVKAAVVAMISAADAAGADPITHVCNS